MNKEQLKELSVISNEILKDKHAVIEIVQWASLENDRIEKIMTFLNNNTNISFSDVRFEMARIVFQETCKKKHQLGRNS